MQAADFFPISSEVLLLEDAYPNTLTGQPKLHDGTNLDVQHNKIYDQKNEHT